MSEIKLKDCYDAVAKCSKCNCEYGYDFPTKYIKKVLGRRIKLPGFKPNNLCPICDPNYKEKPKNLKPKHLNTSETTNNCNLTGVKQ
jgi:hypothetical protein